MSSICTGPPSICCATLATKRIRLENCPPKQAEEEAEAEAEAETEKTSE